MRVYVWCGGIHPINETLISDSPEGVQIDSNVDCEDVFGYGGPNQRIPLRSKAKTQVDRLLFGVGLPRMVPVFSDADVVHTVSGIVPICLSPWVTSIESPSSFFGLNDDWRFSDGRKRILCRILRNRRCRKVMSFSDVTRHAFVSSLSQKDGDGLLREKVETVHPAVNPSKFPRAGRRTGNEFRILFIGNHFFDKGGRELYRAVSDLSSSYDVRLDLIAGAPPHHAEAFKHFVDKNRHSWAHWHLESMPRKRLIDQFYPRAHLFAMPSYIDLFGYVLLEAMACGLPVIASKVYAQREMIEDSVNGYLVSPPITPFDQESCARTSPMVACYRNRILQERLFEPVRIQLREKIRSLIEDESLRTQMALKSVEMTTRGQFGVEARNRKLVKIYREAIE